MTILAVAFGGALGAVLRYLFTQIPLLTGHDFPWMTLTANLMGALLIGFIAGALVNHVRLTPSQISFVKTGFCGGLTTFSTFSLESFELFQHGRYVLAGTYIILSIFLCLSGIFLGRTIANFTFSP